LSRLSIKDAFVAFADELKVDGAKIGAAIADNKDKSRTLDRNVANRARLIKAAPKYEEWNVPSILEDYSIKMGAGNSLFKARS
jgi:hypothetical protein